MKTSLFTASFLLAFGMLTMEEVDGAEIILFNTGIDASGEVLPGGSLDPHWQVTSGPGITVSVPAEVLNSPPSVYASSAESRWIWVESDGGAGVNTPYVFTQTFDLSGFDLSTATISGSWGVDNIGFIRLNGQTSGIGSGTLSLSGGSSATSNFNTFHDFALNDGFVSGVNTLEFVLTDLGAPGGFNLTALTGSAAIIPEPSIYALLIGAGTLAFAFARRRFRKE